MPVVNYKKVEIATIQKKYFNAILSSSKFHKKESETLIVFENFFSKDKEVKPREIYFNNQGVEIPKPNAKSKFSHFLLIIESPHKDEYNEDFMPIETAHGQTGTKIVNYFNRILKSNNFNQALESIIKVTIYNPVPLQTSLYKITNQFNRTLRNSIWKFCWEDKSGLGYRDRFINEIAKKKNYDVVINACTHKLKKHVCEALIEANIVSHFHYYHPASWGENNSLIPRNNCQNF